MGYDIKQRIVESVKSTWKTLNDFAYAHKSAPPPQEVVQEEVDNVLSQMTPSDSKEDDLACMYFYHLFCSLNNYRIE